jgi:hypothetical protein
MEFFDKMSLVFERFEVINGQRDTWQNLLVKKWVESMNAGTIEKSEKNSASKLLITAVTLTGK